MSLSWSNHYLLLTQGITNLVFDTGIATKQGRVVIADRGNHCLWIYTANGQLLARFGQQGSNPGDLHYPMGVAIDDDGNIFTSESGNHRISVFTAGGKFVRCFGRKGTDPGMFQNPRHLCFDPHGRLVVVDEQNQRLQLFSVSVNYYGTVGQRGTKWQELTLSLSSFIIHSHIKKATSCYFIHSSS